MQQPLLRSIVARRTITLPGPNGQRVLTSENDLLSIFPPADGVKTGHTNRAGYVQVAHATDPRTGVGLFAVVMGDTSRAQRAADEKALLSWGFRRYAKPTVLSKGTVVVHVPVEGAPGRDVALVPATDVAGVVRIGKPIRMRVKALAQVAAPTAAGARAGTVEVLQDNAVVARRPLVVASDVAAPGFLEQIRSAFEGIGSVFT
jgi:D-alanyl-D-alanine carboxypeptidase (penicillin-binding protein 5/6)